MTATTERTGKLRQLVDVNGRHTIVTDEPLRLGGTDGGPAPHELLPAALGSCIATMIALYAERHGWDVGDARVEVGYHPDHTPRRVDIEIHLPESLSDDQVKRLERVAETCPLRRALEAGFEFEERVVSSPISPRAA
ncbi:MAG TPA: OsmC family protein [Solirubrobacterales bacterium]|nr:OsmC family protein [Solirubrobacterales bacterium]